MTTTASTEERRVFLDRQIVVKPLVFITLLLAFSWAQSNARGEADTKSTATLESCNYIAKRTQTHDWIIFGPQQNVENTFLQLKTHAGCWFVDFL